MLPWLMNENILENCTTHYHNKFSLQKPTDKTRIYFRDKYFTLCCFAYEAFIKNQKIVAKREASLTFP